MESFAQNDVETTKVTKQITKAGKLSDWTAY